MFDDTYQNRSVFITGHTGFKGAWLSLWLNRLGAKVTGYALNPLTTPNIYELAQLATYVHSVIGDIRDLTSLKQALIDSQPEIVFHLAAQPLVIESYKNPLETFDTNVMGTANLLEAARSVQSIKAIVVITTDKVYADQQWEYSYRENDALGGKDPYSASKAACELVVNAYRESFFKDLNIRVVSARAGNVIGGGDYADNRIVPDIIRAAESGATLQLRNPKAIRPWQHVLDPLSGYLKLGQILLTTEELRDDFPMTWNFGPNNTSYSVLDLVTHLKQHYADLTWQVQEATYTETHALQINIDRAMRLLKWQPTWDFSRTIAHTASWYQKIHSSDAVTLCMQDIADFEKTQ